MRWYAKADPGSGGSSSLGRVFGLQSSPGSGSDPGGCRMLGIRGIPPGLAKTPLNQKFADANYGSGWDPLDHEFGDAGYGSGARLGRGMLDDGRVPFEEPCREAAGSKTNNRGGEE